MIQLQQLTELLKKARQASEQHALKFKTQVSCEGLENISDDFMAGVKWAIEQREWSDEPEPAKEIEPCRNCGERVEPLDKDSPHSFCPVCYS